MSKWYLNKSSFKKYNNINDEDEIVDLSKRINRLKIYIKKKDNKKLKNHTEEEKEKWRINELKNMKMFFFLKNMKMFFFFLKNIKIFFFVWLHLCMLSYIDREKKITVF